MSYLKIKAAFLLLLASAAVPSTAKWNHDYDYWQVDIINGLSHGKTLLIHCKSKDDDLGVQTRPVMGVYSFRFKPNEWGKTLFWCYLAPDRKSHAAFDVSWDNDKLWDKTDLQSVIWLAKDDGIYLRDVHNQVNEFRCKWQPGRKMKKNYVVQQNLTMISEDNILA